MNTKYISLAIPLVVLGACGECKKQDAKPNILFIVADDQSYPYTSAYGSKMVNTPAFDFVAQNGILFNNAYVTSPGCSPSRACILTGRYPWQLEEAGTHASSFQGKYICFPDLLANVGYHIGYTGKGWAPGDWKVSGREHNPAGPEYNKYKLKPPQSGISNIDYTENFKLFLSLRKDGQPFYFWFGSNEPHRDFEKDSWREMDRNLSEAEYPQFLPVSDSIGGDLLDYAVEIAWYDKHLQNMIDILKINGELDNTIIVVTADNGMAFPRAKANCYDYGVHVPLAICWGKNIKKGEVVNELTSMINIAPTILDAAGVKINSEFPITGKSILPQLKGDAKFENEAVFFGRERHSSSRRDNLGYPIRAVREKDYLLVRNFRPERNPAGDPQEIKADGTIGKPFAAYYDIDNSPSLRYLTNNRLDDKVSKYFHLSVDKRPEYELFNVVHDPACINDISTLEPDVMENLKLILNNKLLETADPRIGENPEVWESYPRLRGVIRDFAN